MQSALSMCVSAMDGDVFVVRVLQRCRDFQKAGAENSMSCKSLQAQNTLGLRVVCGTNHVMGSTAVCRNKVVDSAWNPGVSSPRVTCATAFASGFAVRLGMEDKRSRVHKANRTVTPEIHTV